MELSIGYFEENTSLASLKDANARVDIGQGLHELQDAIDRLKGRTSLINSEITAWFDSGNYTISKNVESGGSGPSQYTQQGDTAGIDSYNLKLERGISPLDEIEIVLERSFGTPPKLP